MLALACNKMEVSLGLSMLGGSILVQAREVLDAQVLFDSSNQNKKVRAIEKLNFIRLRLMR